MRGRVAALTSYTRRPRPALESSFPIYMDGELQRLDTGSSAIVQILKDLDARLTALGG